MSEHALRHQDSFDADLRHLGSERGFWVPDWSGTPWLVCSSASMAPASGHEGRVCRGTRGWQWFSRDLKHGLAFYPSSRGGTLRSSPASG